MDFQGLEFRVLDLTLRVKSSGFRFRDHFQALLGVHAAPEQQP